MIALSRRFLVVALLPAGGLACGSCLFQSEPDADHRPLDFVSLAVPAEIGPADTPVVDVSFLVGPNGCWDLDDLAVRREGAVLHVEGSARNPNPEGACTEALVYGRRALPLPPLAAGEYVVHAGELFQNVTVTASPSGAKDRFIYLGSVKPDGSGCDLVGHSALQVAFSGLPSVPGDTYVVFGEITGADPCMYADLPGAVIDYFVTVEVVAPAGGKVAD
jgi:hypothetical protein